MIILFEPHEHSSSSIDSYYIVFLMFAIWFGLVWAKFESNWILIRILRYSILNNCGWMLLHRIAVNSKFRWIRQTLASYRKSCVHVHPIFIVFNEALDAHLTNSSGRMGYTPICQFPHVSETSAFQVPSSWATATCPILLVCFFLLLCTLVSQGWRYLFVPDFSFSPRSKDTLSS